MFGLNKLFSFGSNAIFRPIQSTLFSPSIFLSIGLNAQSLVSQFRFKHYKLKTHKGCAKRFKKTSTGYKRWQCGKNHLNASLTGERRGRLRGSVVTTKTQAKMLDRMIQS